MPTIPNYTYRLTLMILTHLFSCLRDAIADVRSWMITSKLKINDDKTEFLILSSQRMSPTQDLALTIGSSQIQPTRSAKNLGVIIDNRLKMDNHIASVSRSCLFHLRNISSIRRLLSDNATAKLIHALVSCRLN